MRGRFYDKGSKKLRGWDKKVRYRGKKVCCTECGMFLYPLYLSPKLPGIL